MEHRRVLMPLRPRRDEHSAPPDQRLAAPQQQVLALQRAAGNRATASLLQRNGNGKDGETDPPPKEEGKQDEREASAPEGKELALSVGSDAELSALPELVVVAAPPSTAPAPVAKTKVRAIIYAPFTGHRDLGLEELNQRPEEGAKDDPMARLALLEAKLDAAVAKANELHGPEAPDTLRVFLAPEWFFTGKEGDRPYTLEQVHEVIAGLEAISEKHPDIVLAPGSIRWARPEPEPAPWPPQRGRKTMWERVFGAADPEPAPVMEALFNSAVILHGGEMKFMYHKQHEGTDYGGKPRSEQSFANEVEGNWSFNAWQKGSPEVATPKPGSEPKPTATPNTLRRTGAPSNLFTIEGVDFAIDICADFGRGTALREYIDTQATGEGVDVHLVMAAGIAGQLGPATTVARVGGYTMLAEGGAMKARPEGRTKVGKVTERKGTLEQASRGYNSAKNETVTYEEETDKTFVEPERKDLVIFDDVLVLPPRPPGQPSPEAQELGAK